MRTSVLGLGAVARRPLILSRPEGRDPPVQSHYDNGERQFAARLVDAGLITEDDMREVHAFTQDPGSRWLSLGLVTAWGRRG